MSKHQTKPDKRQFVLWSRKKWTKNKKIIVIILVFLMIVILAIASWFYIFDIGKKSNSKAALDNVERLISSQDHQAASVEMQNYVNMLSQDDPKYVSAIIRLGKIQIDAGNKDEAYVSLKKADELWQGSFSDKKDLYETLASLTEQLGKKQEALAYYELLLQNLVLDNNDPSSYLYKFDYEKKISELR